MVVIQQFVIDIDVVCVLDQVRNVHLIQNFTISGWIRLCAIKKTQFLRTTMMPNKIRLKPIPQTNKDDPIENLANQLRELANDRKADKQFRSRLETVMDALVTQVAQLATNGKSLCPTRQEILRLKTESSNSTDQVTRISQWIGRVFRSICEDTYTSYKNAAINERELRLTYCNRLLKQICILMSQIQSVSLKASILDIVQGESKKVLTFLLKKYPQSVSRSSAGKLAGEVEQKKQEGDPKYDILKNMGLDLFRGPEQDYIRDVKVLLNELIKQSRKAYANFKKTMSQIFERHQGVHYKIGMKIKEETQLFSQQQIQSPQLKIQSPEILRILIKWDEELRGYFEQRKSFVESVFPFKSLKNQTVKLNEQLKNRLVYFLKTTFRQTVQPNLKSTEQKLDKLVAQIFTLIDRSPQLFPYLNPQQAKVGRLSALISSVLPGYLINSISQLISGLRKLSHSQFQSLTNIDLVKFSVYDLLRCKCEAPIQEIIQIYNQIKKKESFCEIIRVKNRLSLGNRDILINFKLKESYLICEMQLAVSNNSEEVNDSFNHFLYEQSRSSFGPVVECATILNNLQPQAQFWRNIKGNRKNVGVEYDEVQKKYKCKACLSNCQLSEDKTPFICMTCEEVFQIWLPALSPLLCSTCQFKTCSSCFYSISPQNLQNGLLLSLLEEEIHFFDSSFQRINQQQIPQSCIPKNAYALNVRVYPTNIEKIIVKRLNCGRIVEAFSTLRKTPSANKKSNNCIESILLLPKTKPELILFQTLQNQQNVEYMIPPKNSHILPYAFQKNLQAVVLKSKKKAHTFYIVMDIQEAQTEIIQKQRISRFQDVITSQNKLLRGIINATDLQLNREIEELSKIKSPQLIRSVNLMNNLISNADSLQQFSGVMQLVLSNNELSDCNFIKQLTKIRQLDLSNNKITDLDVQACVQLEQLQVRQNKLKSLKIKNCKKLYNIDASENLFKSFPQIPPSILKLNLSANQISDCLTLKEHKTLQTLDLSSNCLEKITELKLPSLVSLNLKFNELKEIEALGNSTLSSLKQLNLENNKIEKVVFLPFAVVELNLRRNSISGIEFLSDESKEKYRNSLESLNLSSNCITLQDAPKLYLPSLHYLNLNENPIDDISPIINSIPEIQYLTVCDCKIKSIPAMRLLKLKELELSRNEIQSVMMLAQSELPQLTTIGLRKNRLVRIQYVNFPRLKKILVEGNELDESTMNHLMVRMMVSER